MNILITGANGQLGHCMQNVAKQQSDNKYIFTDVCEGYTHLDITNLEAIREMVAEQHINCIVNCAAWTNVDAAETAGEIVETLNAKAPENLAKAMKEVGGLLIHISSDYVFGGDPYNTPCREDQKGTPTGVYGLTKLHGEQKIQAVGGSYVILRTSWLYSEYGKNFVKTMLNLTATKPQLKVVFDQVGTPTYAGDLANAIERIIEDYIEDPSQPPLERGGVPTAEKQQETQAEVNSSPLEGRMGRGLQRRRVLMVRFYQSHCTIGRQHSVRDSTMPFIRVFFPCHTPIIQCARQNKNQGNIQPFYPLLARLFA
jgi:dTDP-4-dehydrorhamnose reductase